LRDKDGNLVPIDDPRAIEFYRHAGRAGAAGGGAAPGYMGRYLTHLDRGEHGGVYAGSAAFRRAIAAGHEEYRPYQSGRSKHWVKVKNRKHPAMSRVME